MKQAALFVVLAVGCGDGGSSGPITRADYPRESAAAFCAKAYECCNAGELAALGVTSEANCVEVVSAQYADAVAYTSPNTDYDADAAGECRDQAVSASCAAFFGSADTAAPACDQVFSGTLANGAECEIDTECESDYCEFDFEANANTCATLPGSGEACEFNCAAGLACIDGMCDEPLANGAACMFDGECESGRCDGTVCAEPAPTAASCDGP